MLNFHLINERIYLSTLILKYRKNFKNYCEVLNQTTFQLSIYDHEDFEEWCIFSNKSLIL